MEEIYCSDCQKRLSVDEITCSNCGSKKKHIKLKLEEKIKLQDHIQLKGKTREKGFKRPIQEFKVGDDYHKKSGQWNKREMYIDRKNDSYKEIIKDGVTGEIRQYDEPLSKHKGHGSAKKKQK